MVSADGLRRGQLSSAGAQLVCPHRCTGWRCWALHLQGALSTACICLPAGENSSHPFLTWCRGRSPDPHTCVHQQNRIMLLTSLAKILEINWENVLSKSWRLSGLECLFLQSRGDGVILNLFFCAKKKPEDYFLSSMSWNSSGLLISNCACQIRPSAVHSSGECI